MDETRLPPPPLPPRNTLPHFQSHSYGTYPGLGSPWSSMSPYQHSYGNNFSQFQNSPYNFGYNAGSNLSSLVPSPARGPFETVESVVQAVSSIR